MPFPFVNEVGVDDNRRQLYVAATAPVVPAPPLVRRTPRALHERGSPRRRPVRGARVGLEMRSATFIGTDCSKSVLR